MQTGRRWAGPFMQALPTYFFFSSDGIGGGVDGAGVGAGEVAGGGAPPVPPAPPPGDDGAPACLPQAASVETANTAEMNSIDVFMFRSSKANKTECSGGLPSKGGN
jgi:hypothetical protein